MSAIDVAHIDPPALKGYQNVTANTVDVLALIARAMKTLRWHVAPVPMLVDGEVVYMLTFKQLNIDGAEIQDSIMHCHPGYWIFATDDDSVSYLEVCDPAAAVARFCGTNSADVPLVWAASDTAPAVVANEDGTAVITVPQPDSINGPWTYSVKDGAGAAVAVLSTDIQPARADSGLVLGSQIALTVDADLDDTERTFAVTVACDSHPDVTATSLPTVPVTRLVPPADDDPPEDPPQE